MGRGLLLAAPVSWYRQPGLFLLIPTLYRHHNIVAIDAQETAGSAAESSTWRGTGTDRLRGASWKPLYIH